MGDNPVCSGIRQVLPSKLHLWQVVSSHILDIAALAYRHGAYPVVIQVPGMTPQQLTTLNLDKTAVLEDLLQRNYKGESDGLLGEMQFSFLAFLMGHSLEGTDPHTTSSLCPVMAVPC